MCHLKSPYGPRCPYLGYLGAWAPCFWLMGARRLCEQEKDTIRKNSPGGRVFEKKDAICIILGDKNEEADLSRAAGEKGS